MSIFFVGSIFAGFTEGAVKVNSQQLINNMKNFDNTTVILRGEVIGDIMPRGDFVWFNLQDEFNVIGIWAPREMESIVTQTGDYERKGDIVEVEGKFLKADPQLEGELCIRAQRINVLKEGYRTFHVLKPQKEEFAFTLSLIAFCLVGITWLVIKNRKQKI